jgi:siroheme synthase-like protein
VSVHQPPYPVNLLLRDRRVLVVGGGVVAAQKVEGLLAAEAVVHVVSLEVREAVRALPVTWEERPYERGDVVGYRLAVACTDDPAVNRAVYDDGEAANIWVNAADDPVSCSYTLPARAQRGPLLLTVSTSGHSPALSGWLRDQLAADLGPEHDALLDMLADARRTLAARGERRPPPDWRRALDSGMLDKIRRGQIAEAREVLHQALRLDEPSATGSRQGA